MTAPLSDLRNALVRAKNRSRDVGSCEVAGAPSEHVTAIEEEKAAWAAVDRALEAVEAEHLELKREIGHQSALYTSEFLAREYNIVLRWEEAESGLGAWVAILEEPDLVTQGGTWGEALNRMERSLLIEPIIREHLRRYINAPDGVEQRGSTSTPDSSPTRNMNQKDLP